ncbi:LptE family protein [Desulfobulbus sp.]|uniref:LptE family protein n=1 Tax=Desulfobulbus sp. TaxID=895 RepID=UPI00286EEE05|nr:LptE family protein [Desulfobulbus sp.]
MLNRAFWDWKLLLLAALLLGGCGYTFPHVYEGQPHAIYMPTWQNRTNKLGLDMKIYQSLGRWFQKSSSVSITKEKAGADLILTGEILSIDLPSVSWNTVSEVTGTKVNLIVRYALKDKATGKMLWEVRDKLYSADYSMSTVSSAADEQALTKIIDDLSEDIYVGALKKIRKQQLQQQTQQQAQQQTSSPPVKTLEVFPQHQTQQQPQPQTQPQTAAP